MMGKLSQMKNKFLKFLPKRPVASVAAYQNPNLSPTSSATPKGCRSSLKNVSIIPKKHRRSTSFSAREPSSPKVSCMGKVQCKKMNSKRVHQTSTKKSEKKNVLHWTFKKSGEGPKQSGKDLVLKEEVVNSTSPSLGSMKKFTSGRGSLANFDATHAER